MSHSWINRILVVWITTFSLWAAVPAMAGDFRESRSGYKAPDARWQLNPAGQLELWFDPLHNGRSEWSETYTVVLNDRAPKMCGDPDGTGRHTWFFTDALMIEILPIPERGAENSDRPSGGAALP